MLFSLAGGALLGFDTGPYLRSELSLAAGLWALLDAGDMLLGDRNFSSYRVLAADGGPERPGRREPNALKRRPKPFPRLNCARALFVDPPRRTPRKKSNA